MPDLIRLPQSIWLPTHNRVIAAFTHHAAGDPTAEVATNQQDPGGR